jgi:acyl carrier protein
MSNIEEKVKSIISDQLGLPVDAPMDSSAEVSDLCEDSLDPIEIVMSLEEEYDIEIPDEDAEKMLTVQDVINYIENHIPKL